MMIEASTLREQGMEAFRLHSKLRQIEDELRSAWDTPRRWALIRKGYSLVSERLEGGRRMSPYIMGLADHLTPIEVGIWHDIRMYGLPFYMQYPVGRRFVDFGDPYQKVAIEADGKNWHTPEKDAQKDNDLRGQGWYVVRIKGRDCWRPNALHDFIRRFYPDRHMEEMEEREDA